MTKSDFFKMSLDEQRAYLNAEGEEVEYFPADGNYERYIYFIPEGKFYVTAFIGESKEIERIENL